MAKVVPQNDVLLAALSFSIPQNKIAHMPHMPKAHLQQLQYHVNIDEIHCRGLHDVTRVSMYSMK